MSARPAPQTAAAPEPAQAPTLRREAHPRLLLPHLSVHCFLIGNDGLEAAAAYGTDRVMTHVTVALDTGGLDAAIAHFADAKTPDLLFVEVDLDRDVLAMELDRLAEVCHADTKVVLIGRRNDIGIYRMAIAQGVADYLPAPVTSQELIEVTERIFMPNGEPARVGRVVAVLPAKGGCGSSTLARNLAWSMAKADGRQVALVDLDLPFGDDALACDVDGRPDAGEAMRNSERLDAALLEHLFVKIGARLSLLAGPAALPDEGAAPSAQAMEKLIDVARRQVPLVVLDLPHIWAPWVIAALRAADAIAVVSTPTLASLRNTGLLMDTLSKMRPNDPPPLVVLNKTGASTAGEVPPKQRNAALNFPISHEIAYDHRSFGVAEFAGMLICEKGPKRVTDTIGNLAHELANGSTARDAQKRGALWKWLKF
jgi:pilus assembly protein CpaE